MKFPGSWISSIFEILKTTKWIVNGYIGNMVTCFFLLTCAAGQRDCVTRRVSGLQTECPRQVLIVLVRVFDNSRSLIFETAFETAFEEGFGIFEKTLDT